MTDEARIDILSELTKSHSEEEWVQILSYYINRIDQSNDYYEQLNTLSLDYFNKGYFDQALYIMIELYRGNPTSQRAYNIGLRLYQYGQYEMAYYEWLPKARVGQENVKVLILEARLLYKLLEVDQAISKYRYIVKQYPLEEESYEELADIYIEEGNPSLAENLYQALFDYFSDYPNLRMVRLKLIDILMNKEIIERENIDKLFNDERIPLLTAEEYYAFALYQQRLLNYETAVEYILKAIELDQDQLNYSIFLMDLYYDLGEENKLIDLIQWIIHTLPPTDDRIVKVASMCQTIHYDSIELMNKLKDYFPFSTSIDEAYQILKMMINFYLDQGQAEQALLILNDYGLSSLEDEYLSYFYARVNEALNKLEDVEYLYQTALDYLLAEEDLLYHFAQFYDKTGQKQKALELIEKYEYSDYANEKLLALKEKLMK